jgi:hypothetical protein
VQFFARHGLELFDVRKIGNKGGSIRGFVQKRGGPRSISRECRALVAQEMDRGLASPETYRRYTRDIAQAKHQLLSLLQDLKQRGRKIAGFGASATVTTLIYNFELAPWLNFLVDDNTSRHGLYSPGHHLPVLPPAELTRAGIDVVLILAWQYAEPIMKKHRTFLDGGGTFIVPLPQPQIIRNTLAPAGQE